jgi:hypothetical protein
MLTTLFVAAAVAAPVTRDHVSMILSEDVMTATVAFYAGAYNDQSATFVDDKIDAAEVKSCFAQWLRRSSIHIDVVPVDTAIKSALFEGFSGEKLGAFQVFMSLKSAYAMTELTEELMKPWPTCDNITLKSTSATSTTTSTGIDQFSVSA